MFCGGLDGANIEDFFRFGVRNALRCQGDYTNNNKDHADNRNASHTDIDARHGPTIGHWTIGIDVNEPDGLKRRPTPDNGPVLWN